MDDISKIRSRHPAQGVNFILMILITLLFSSCFRCSCHCENCNGCAIMEARDFTSDKLLERKTYCSTENFLLDTIVNDSCQQFSNRHRNLAALSRRDSLFSCDTIAGLTCKETEGLKKYRCICAK